jgi:hypothetical protein
MPGLVPGIHAFLSEKRKRLTTKEGKEDQGEEEENYSFLSFTSFVPSW